jgi:hypothetical protein
VGRDDIVPALLQQGMEHLLLYQCHIFRACLAYGYIHMACRKVRATFIPKPRKSDYTEAKAYCPIGLFSFILKMMKKLVDRHIRDGVLKEYLLHQNQHAYQTGKSTTETALHNVVSRIESAIEYKELALRSFLDIYIRSF